MPTGSTRSVMFRLLKWAVIILVVVLLLPYLLTPLYRFVDPVSTLMLWRRAAFARVERTWVPLATMAPALPRAVMVAEDARFCTHRGVDFSSATRWRMPTISRNARRLDHRAADRQNLFLWPERSVVRKGLGFRSRSGSTWCSAACLMRSAPAS